jgi:LmbE family N-acetylglucosaminyl deacetylase
MVKALAIVAHPDDETIWMGGMIMKNKDWDWTVVSLCRASDSDRAPKFRKVCSELKAKAVILDLDDEEMFSVSNEEISKLIVENIDDLDYDFVFTHGSNGEYGHMRHIEIHNAVLNMVRNNKLKCSKLYNFSYIPGKISAPHDKELMIPIPDNNSDEVIELDDAEYKNKFNLVAETYGFKHPIFETLSCSKFEAFNIVK